MTRGAHAIVAGMLPLALLPARGEEPAPPDFGVVVPNAIDRGGQPGGAQLEYLRACAFDAGPPGRSGCLLPFSRSQPF